MAITPIPSIATEMRPLFAGRSGPLWQVEFSGLGLPLAASDLRLRSRSPSARRRAVLRLRLMSTNPAGRPPRYRDDGEPFSVNPWCLLPLAMPSAACRRCRRAAPEMAAARLRAAWECCPFSSSVTPMNGDRWRCRPEGCGEEAGRISSGLAEWSCAVL